MTSQYLNALHTLGPAVTLMTDHPLVCAGIAIQGFGVGTLWAFVGEDAGPYMVRLHRYAQRLLALHPLRRVDATTNFVSGARWLDLLGFKYEGTMRKYGPAGEDQWLYARVA